MLQCSAELKRARDADDDSLCHYKSQVQVQVTLFIPVGRFVLQLREMASILPFKTALTNSQRHKNRNML